MDSMASLILIGCIFCLATGASQIASVLAVVLRLRLRQGDRHNAGQQPAITILRPVCGHENFIEQTLLSTFQLDYPHYEILFCVADGNDPVVPLVHELIAAHPQVDARLLIGNNRVSSNPKLNNLVKGWHAARHDWVVMVDSNVLMPAAHLQRMLASWQPDTGLVCSPPIGGAPQNAWAELECSFLNTYQARWQYFAESIGLGFAQGKSMLWRRDLLDAAGGIEALGQEIAEDAAATKIVRGQGLRVRLVDAAFVQPLGHRRAIDVWRRQIRWARLRRETFTWFFLPELFVGAALPAVAVGAVAAAAGWPVIGTLAPFLAIWYATEAILACVAGWQFSSRSVFIWMLRDALLPVLWFAAWAGNDFEWRGNAMTVAISDPAQS
jgi:ceramide glucosyltransferase